MYRKKSLTNFILLALEKTVDGTIRLDDFMSNPGYYSYHGGWDYPLKKSALARTLKRVREYGLVELLNNQEIILRLTDTGKEKAVLAKLLFDEGKWDGRYRIVIFDIPEKRRIARDLLRSKLKNWGFVPWQRSVWATKKNCTKPLRDFIKQVGIKDWVKVIESDNVN